MYIRVKGDLLEVKIEHKRTTRNTYMRVKEGNVLQVTTNPFTTEGKIRKILTEHIKEIERMYEFQKKKESYEDKFYYLGKEYDVVGTNEKEVRLGTSKVFIPKDFDINKWYLEKAQPVFQEHLDACYHKFSRVIPYPTLKVRKMKSRWGVCNTKTHAVTLNLELIKRETHLLDYVIYHELSHLIEGNHSKRFWNVVEENFPDYKEARDELKRYE